MPSTHHVAPVPMDNVTLREALTQKLDDALEQSFSWPSEMEGYSKLFPKSFGLPIHEAPKSTTCDGPTVL